MVRKEFERVSPPQVGISCKSIHRLLDELENTTEMHGIMIMRHGKVCAEGWWAPYAPGLRHGLQSLSKTYAATAIGIAYTEGLLDLEDKIVDIFRQEAPENPSENLKKLKIRDVLCMGCGMDEMPKPSEKWIKDFLATPVNHEPGTAFMYNSMGSTLLAAIIKKETGQNLHDYLTTRLFHKIGIDPENLLWMHMPDGTEIGGGGLFATTEDNLRLLKLYADGGVWEGERILCEKYVREATSAQNQNASEALKNPNATDNFVGYGYQLWMCKPKGVYRADGAMGQFAIVCPDLDILISINETGTGARRVQQVLDIIWGFFDEARAGAPEDLPRESTLLKKRMSTLALHAPVFAPCSPAIVDINHKKYRVINGRFCLENSVVPMMTGNMPTEGIRSFSFSFGHDGCDFELIQGGETHRVSIATDGTRRQNTLVLKDEPTDKLLLNGYWSCSDTFCIVSRFIETCFEKRTDFTFKGSKVYIKSTVTSGLSLPSNECANNEEILAEAKE